LSGCVSVSSRPDTVIKDLPADKRQAMSAVRILNQAQLQGAKFDVLTIVEGTSCRHWMTDPPASRTSAIEQLKLKASEAGANAISNIQCDGREPTNYTMNCWESMTCAAEAIKLQP
jgi:uncharacterized protein YbjQ (UPF0145 family)